MEEHDYTSKDLGPDEDLPPLLVLWHSRALLAEGDEGLRVGPDLLLELDLVKERDGHHAVGLVTLAQVFAGRALPLIEHLALGLGQSGGEVLGHGPGLDITWIF